MLLCQRCNQLGHTLKYCTINNNNNNSNRSLRYQICSLCKVEGHGSEDCKLAKLLVSQIKDNNYERKGDFNQFKNKSTDNNQNNQSYNRDRPNKGRFCIFCKMNNHTIEYCRKLKLLENTKRIENCGFCKLDGHNIDNCQKIKTLVEQFDKFCNNCKLTTHTTEECSRKTNPGNE